MAAMASGENHHCLNATNEWQNEKLLGYCDLGQKIRKFCPLAIKEVKKYMLFASWEVCALWREGTVIFDRDRPRLVNNGFIFKKMV